MAQRTKSMLFLALGVCVFLCSTPTDLWGEPIGSARVGGTNPESGNSVSGMADFSVSDMELTVRLRNISGPLATNGDVLTGVLFDPSVTDLTLTRAEVRSGRIWESKTDGSTTSPPVDWTGSWTDAYGIAPPPAGTVGAAATGFGGMFAAAGITLGTGSADYGIISNATYPQTGNGPGNPNKFPLADDEVVLTFTSNQSLGALAIGNVRLLYGTSGQGIIVPEPNSLLLALASTLAVLAVARRRQAE